MSHECTGRLQLSFHLHYCKAGDHEGAHRGGGIYWYDDEPGAYRAGQEPDHRVTFTTKSSGEQAAFDGGGVRDVETGKPRFDLLCPEAVPYEKQFLTRIAALMGRGAEKYEDRNWEQFADEEALKRAKSSAFRHFMQWFNGETDEDHAAAVFFNVQGAEYVAGRMNGDW